MLCFSHNSHPFTKEKSLLLEQVNGNRYQVCTHVKLANNLIIDAFVYLCNFNTFVNKCNRRKNIFICARLLLETITTITKLVACYTYKILIYTPISKLNSYIFSVILYPSVKIINEYNFKRNHLWKYKTDQSCKWFLLTSFC